MADHTLSPWKGAIISSSFDNDCIHYDSEYGIFIAIGGFISVAQFASNLLGLPKDISLHLDSIAASDKNLKCNGYIKFNYDVECMACGDIEWESECNTAMAPCTKICTWLFDMLPKIKYGIEYSQNLDKFIDCLNNYNWSKLSDRIALISKRIMEQKILKNKL